MTFTAFARLLALAGFAGLALCGTAAAQRPASDDIPRTPASDETTEAPAAEADEAWPPGYDRTRVPGQPVPRDARAADGGVPRVTLISTGRPVVLLGGGAGNVRRDARIAPDAERTILQARIEAGPDGQPVVTYEEPPVLPADIGRDLGCGPAAGRSLDLLRTLSAAPLVLMDEGPLVGAAQQLLCVVGYAAPQDGAFGEDMGAALLAFQEDYNAALSDDVAETERLVESGVLDERTRQVLDLRARGVLGE